MTDWTTSLERRQCAGLRPENDRLYLLKPESKIQEKETTSWSETAWLQQHRLNFTYTTPVLPHKDPHAMRGKDPTQGPPRTSFLSIIPLIAVVTVCSREEELELVLQRTTTHWSCSPVIDLIRWVTISHRISSSYTNIMHEEHTYNVVWKQIHSFPWGKNH